MTTIPIMSEAFNDPRILRGMEKQLRVRQDRLKVGEKLVGWKVGFGAAAALQRLGLDAPLIGFLTEKMLLPSNASIPILGWTKPAAEPEVAVYMGQDLTGTIDAASTRAAIASLGPAIEIADVHFPPDDVEAILAGNIYNRHVILGRPDSLRASANLHGLIGHISHNEEELPTVLDLQALTGNIVDIVSHVASLLSYLGEGLRNGEFIICGSIVPPLWVVPKDRITYRLEPIDTIAVNLS